MDTPVPEDFYALQPRDESQGLLLIPRLRRVWKPTRLYIVDRPSGPRFSCRS